MSAPQKNKDCGGGSSSQKSTPRTKEQKRKVKEDNSARKQRVFFNRTSMSVPAQEKTMQQPILLPSTTLPNNYFGPQIPDDVMENVLFRFLYNIPENEKNDQIRVCFHVELAHWFYLDIYCPENSEPPALNCKKVGFHQFVRQVFFKCDYLENWRTSVDKIIDAFRQYKSSVPTYGVVMIDPTLNYILLVQGYYASKNSWGFPKGKINEGEIPLECAVREAYEEVGFDATDHLSNKIRPMQSFIGDTLVCLYIATDVPMDFAFKPHLQKEIRKISWFSVWDLPKDRNDDTILAQLGLHPNNFYSVLPFINNICEFISRERAERKPKCSALKEEGKSESSAFQPFVPGALSNQKQPSFSAASQSSSAQNTQKDKASTSNQLVFDNLFKPLNVEPDKQPTIPSQSFTGQTFLEQYVKTAVGSDDQAASASTGSSEKGQQQQIPQNPAGVIGDESRRRHKEIKQPKPLHASNLILNVYEAPPENQQQQQPKQQTSISPIGPIGKSAKKKKRASTSGPSEAATEKTSTPLLMPSALLLETPKIKKHETKQNEQKQKQTLEVSADCVAAATMPQSSPNEIVNMLRSSIGKKERSPDKKDGGPIASELIPTQVRLCEAWKKFSLNRVQQIGAVGYSTY